MKRTLIIAACVALVLLAALLGVGYALAETSPLLPGQLFYPLQEFSETARALLINHPTKRAEYYLDLLDRREADLSALSGTGEESAALEALDETLTLAIDALAGVPAEDLDELKARMVAILSDVEATLSNLSIVPIESPRLLEELLARIDTLKAMLALSQNQAEQGSPADVSSAAVGAMATAAVVRQAQNSSAVDPHAVYFPPGSPGAEHAFFPLSGKHASISCQECHVDGMYAGTPNLCTDCHIEDKPEIHYEGQCSICHLATRWTEINFDHSLAVETDCLTCHELDKPAQHYNGPCSACHNTTAWEPASFDHQVAGATNCQSCHRTDRPANHYSGQCSACHNTTSWRNATFNHQVAGATDCQSCHSDDRPANHYSGQCSACHNTTSWRNATFSHKAAGATDCQTCHRNDRPANHFSGQCSACHNTSSWANATFSHKAAGATDCQSCHAQDRPANHFSGQCSGCHNTSNWGDATFKHGGSGTSDCKSCHSSPSNHWSGQCSNCHNTNSWSDVKVSGHRFPMDHGDAGGECSSCHSGTSTSVNCYTCHNRSETEKHHAEEDIFDIGGRCLECHPTGDKGDD